LSYKFTIEFEHIRFLSQNLGIVAAFNLDSKLLSILSCR
jgi:hypothetical protein